MAGLCVTLRSCKGKVREIGRSTALKLHPRSTGSPSSLCSRTPKTPSWPWQIFLPCLSRVARSAFTRFRPRSPPPPPAPLACLSSASRPSQCAPIGPRCDARVRPSSELRSLNVRCFVIVASPAFLLSRTALADAPVPVRQALPDAVTLRHLHFLGRRLLQSERCLALIGAYWPFRDERGH